MGYAELLCRSNFSFLEGASRPEELVDRAAALGLRALALTDRDGVHGVVRAHSRLRELRRTGGGGRGAEELRLLIGSRVTVSGLSPLALIAEDRRGYGNLCELLTRGRRRSDKGFCEVGLDEVAELGEGLQAILLDLTGLGRAREIFGDRLSLGLARTFAPGQEERLGRLVRAGRRLRVPLVAVGDVLYHDPSRKPLQDVLTCIRRGTTLDEAGLALGPNAERCLHGPEEMARRFAELPEALRRSLEIAERCEFSLDMLRYRYPSELLPKGLSAMEHLRALVREGSRSRYPEGVPAAVEAQIERELELIAKLGFPHYFLTVHDLVRFARERDILCQGRGSAANSAVCFVLGITSVDPARSSLLFERFISEERGEPPDIDVDCEHERREEVIQYLYEKYGRDRAAMVTAYVCYRGRSAIREVGKALGFDEERVDALARASFHGHVGDISPAVFAEAGLDPSDPRVRLYGALCRQVSGFPRHMSIHSGGFVLSDEPLERIVPVEKATMEGRTVIQWDKDDLDALGLLKVDVLALGMLTAVHKTFDLVAAHEGRELTMATIPAEDPAVYDMICQADTVGVFQIESRAQMSMLPRLKPRCFYDLVVEVAIVRPGPIQGKMVHPYLRRRNGEEPVTYPHPALREILGRTYGVPLFQEQVMRLAVAVAGFTPGEADELRRAMGAWRRTGRMGELATKLLEGMRESGLAETFALQILDQIKGFAEYGFPESHSASFALIVYASCYLKRYHPAAFAAALVNSQPLGFYPPRTILDDARRHGVAVRPIDVQRSDWDCTLEPYRGGTGEERLGIRLGLRLVKRLQEARGRAVAAARVAGGAFRSLVDLQQRAGLGRGDLEALAAADALRIVEQGDPGEKRSRRVDLWAVRGLAPSGRDLLAAVEPGDVDEGALGLPEASPLEEVVADYDATALSLRAHPVELLREQLDRLSVLRARDLLEASTDRPVAVAGVVLARQRPATASGVVFMSLEDETGMSNVVIWPRVFERYRRVAAGAGLLLVRGRLERTGLVVNVVASEITPLTLTDRPLRAHPRDFR